MIKERDLPLIIKELKDLRDEKNNTYPNYLQRNSGSYVRYEMHPIVLFLELRVSEFNFINTLEGENIEERLTLFLQYALDTLTKYNRGQLGKEWNLRVRENESIPEIPKDYSDFLKIIRNRLSCNKDNYKISEDKINFLLGGTKWSLLLFHTISLETTRY